MIAKIKLLLSHILPGVIRPLRVLWNQIIGLIFLALAIPGLSSGVRAYRRFAQDGETDSLFHVVLAGVFSLLMLWFGVTSFLRARKIGRS